MTDVGQLIRVRLGRSNSTAVHRNVAESPVTFIWYGAKEPNISRSTMQCILMNDLHHHANKIQLTDQLVPYTAKRVRQFEQQ